MARDFVEMKVDSSSLRIISQLLKLDTLGNTPENKKYINQVSLFLLEKLCLFRYGKFSMTIWSKSKVWV